MRTINLHIRTLLPATLLALAIATPSSAMRFGGDPGSCLGDIDGTDDAQINTSDLLFMFASWGDTGPPRPRADIAPFPNGDDLVDVQDLLALLGNWGPCFPTSDFCADALHPANVDAKIIADGSYPFEIVGVLDGPQRGPTNDLADVLRGPTTAFWADYGTGVILGTYQFGDLFGIFMAVETLPFTTGGDTWFLYTASCSGKLFLEVDSGCGIGELTDGQIEIYPGAACPTDWIDIIGWGEDELGGCSGFQPLASADVIAGEDYLIRLGGWGGELGSAVLDVTCIDNSLFDNALPLDLGVSLTGSTNNAQPVNAPTCDLVDVSGPGRWYSIVGNDTTFQATTCGSNLLFDTRLSVYCSFDGTQGNLTCIAAANDDVCGLDEAVQWCAETGREYFILVHGTPGLTPPFTSEGEFLLKVISDEIECSPPTCDPPP